MKFILKLFNRELRCQANILLANSNDS